MPFYLSGGIGPLRYSKRIGGRSKGGSSGGGGGAANLPPAPPLRESFAVAKQRWSAAPRWVQIAGLVVAGAWAAFLLLMFVALVVG